MRSAPADPTPGRAESSNPFRTATAWTPPPVAQRTTGHGDPMTAKAVIAHFRERGAKVIHHGRYAHVSCPAHDDSVPSLSIGTGKNGTPLLHCFGGCETKDVLAAADLTWSQLLGAGGARGNPGVVIRDYDCAYDPRENRHERTPGVSEGLESIVLGDLSTYRVYLGRISPKKTRYVDDVEAHAAWIEMPRGAGSVMRAALKHLAAEFTRRQDHGETRAIPYASRWAAEHLSLPSDGRRVRDACEGARQGRGRGGPGRASPHRR